EKEYQKHAQLPGFRAGKAPRAMVVKAYSADIENEVKRRLIPDSYKKAVAEQKIRVATYPDIEEIQFGRGQTLQFAATLETEPEFELPEYKGIPIKLPAITVSDEDVTKAVEALRTQRAEYKDVPRAIQAGDFVVINYTGACDGRPIAELAPAYRGISEQKNFWVNIQTGQFIPGFTEQLVGASAGEKRTAQVDFPADFMAQPLAGKKGSYEVEIVQVKERHLPEVNDEFAKSFGGENLEKLRAGVKADLENEVKFQRERSAKDQVVRELLARVKCDLPESIVTSETRSVVYNIVQEQTQRGATRESIESQKDQIFNFAAASAKDRVKAMFLLGRIAEKEGVKVEQQEVSQRVLTMAAQYQMPVQKLVKQLDERGGFSEIHEQILTAKVLNLLVEQAKVEEVQPEKKA
ncbi:MAG: trigger factor, partial [Verrucomicrobia bacterium]|nr:trigger factor [Verrucomicrobiota bacterium]